MRAFANLACARTVEQARQAEQRVIDIILDTAGYKEVECCAGCGIEYGTRDCGCPAGSGWTLVKKIA